MEKILTLGVPVYNMERYLSRCLDSVTAIPNLEDVEIIVVNDGSRDGSLEIAREYERRYPASVRVIDKPNGGWGSAINLSVREAKGKYYKSLDSDDWFDTCAFEQFVATLKTIDADMVLTPLREVYDGGGETVRHPFAPRHMGKLMSYIGYVEDGGAGTSIHSRCYSTRLLQANGVAVSERFYADLDYITMPLAYVTTVYVADLTLYQYYLGREGQSVSVQGYRSHYKDFLRVCRNQIDFYGRVAHMTPEPVRRLIWDSLISHLKWGYELLMTPQYCAKSPDAKQELEEFDAYIKTKCQEAYRQTATLKKMGFIPYIRIYRLLGVNVLAFRPTPKQC